MDNITRRDREMPYISDEEVMEQQKKARMLTQKLNTMDRADFQQISKVAAELFGKIRWNFY